MSWEKISLPFDVVPRKYSQLGGKFLAKPLLEKFILSGSLVAIRSANIATRIKNKYMQTPMVA